MLNVTLTEGTDGTLRKLTVDDSDERGRVLECNPLPVRWSEFIIALRIHDDHRTIGMDLDRIEAQALVLALETMLKEIP